MGKGKRKHASPDEDYSTFVEHPRYGQLPRITAESTHAKIGSRSFLHWHSPVECRIPNTTVEAYTSKQCPATVHVTHYFDVIRTCVDCDRKFIFFAEEQKFWYETLKFPLEANCIRCCDCRREQRETSYLRECYETLVKREDLTEEETFELIDCAITLKERGEFGERVVERIRCWMNQLSKNEKIRKRQTFTDLEDRMNQLVANSK